MDPIRVVYVPLNQKPLEFNIDYCQGMTVREALAATRLLEIHPETAYLAVGIFAERVPLDHRLRPGDRIEIYRPLMIDPKEKRRQRAKDMK